MEHELNQIVQPPRIAGDVDIARFPVASDTQRWRVSIAGTAHFLTDAATAWRIQALTAPARNELTYEQAYARYRAVAGEAAEPMPDFIAWCRRHGSSLEKLAETPDIHAMVLRRRLLNATTCRRLAALLSGLFKTPILVLLWMLCLGTLGMFLLKSGSFFNARYAFWSAVPLALVGVFIHELGHITACVRYGARQGGIGIGLYWIWPAFFADVRGSWSLRSGQRLQVSLGGIYFQSIYVAILSVVALVTGNASIAVAIRITLLLMATTLNPILKYDGYWILSDVLNY